MNANQKAYCATVEENLKGIKAVSTGVCPGCEYCAADYGFESVSEFNAAWENGTVFEEGSFSWSSCDICDSSLGGDRYPWHGIIDGKIEHWDNACVDCVFYLAYGTLPEFAE